MYRDMHIDVDGEKAVEPFVDGKPNLIWQRQMTKVAQDILQTGYSTDSTCRDREKKQKNTHTATTDCDGTDGEISAKHNRPHTYCCERIEFVGGKQDRYLQIGNVHKQNFTDAADLHGFTAFVGIQYGKNER